MTVQNDLPRGQPPITPRARTSIAGSRTQAKLESPSSPTKTNNGAISQRVAGTVGSTITTNLAASTNRSMPIKSNLRDVRSLSRSEANITATLNTEPTKQAANRDAITPNPLTTVLTDEEMLKFVSQPISSDVTLQCTIIRDKKGLDRSLYPTYYMHLQGICVVKYEMCRNEPNWFSIQHHSHITTMPVWHNGVIADLLTQFSYEQLVILSIRYSSAPAMAHSP